MPQTRVACFWLSVVCVKDVENNVNSKTYRQCKLQTSVKTQD